MRFLKPKLTSFYSPKLAGAEGLVGITSCITPELLFEAYSYGIFPWSDQPALWYSPHPRAIFDISSLKFARRLERAARQKSFEVTYDREFAEVMARCMAHHAPNSWISPSMIRAYTRFHELGFAHSVEVWNQSELVGGLYGVQMGGVFAGESMFCTQRDASKVAFFHLVCKLRQIGVVLMDSQVLNPHTARLGAVEVARSYYLKLFEQALELDVTMNAWRE